MTSVHKKEGSGACQKDLGIDRGRRAGGFCSDEIWGANNWESRKERPGNEVRL